jgi:hypothetical protein
MDSTRFNREDDLIEHELEQPLEALEPLPGALNRDRMLFEAGRASAQAAARARFLTLAVVTLAVSIGLGLSLVSERSGRHALELAFADLERKQSSTPIDTIPPAPVATNDFSPYSYRALSLVQTPVGFHDPDPREKSSEPVRASAGSNAAQAPLRVRDTGKVLQF